MNIFTAILLCSLIAFKVYSSVIPTITASKGSFKVRQIRNDAFVGRNGATALAKAFLKHGKEIPKHIKAASDRFIDMEIKKRAAGSGVAHSLQSDVEYVVPVDIGTPAQTLYLNFDSGSSDLWVFSNGTPCAFRQGHNLYTPSRSSTSQLLSGASWSIRYGDGSSSSGIVYTDSVSIGPLYVRQQAVETAQKVSSHFISGLDDGVLGLGFSTFNTIKPDKQKTWYESIKPSLDSKLFVADLRHNEDGAYIFGAIPLAAKNISYTELDSSLGVWGFQADTEYGRIESAMADTGTTLLLVPNKVVNRYYKNVLTARYNESEGGVVFSCSERLHDFTFTVGGGRILIPGSYINYGENNGVCFGGIQSSEHIGISVFGNVALKAAYVIFDDTNNRLGWSQKV